MAQRFFAFLSKVDTALPAPFVARDIHAMIREVLDVEDPYKQQKMEANQKALELYPILKARIDASRDPFKRALKYAEIGRASCRERV